MTLMMMASVTLIVVVRRMVFAMMEMGCRKDSFDFFAVSMNGALDSLMVGAVQKKGCLSSMLVQLMVKK
jgi:hypothetical protein